MFLNITDKKIVSSRIFDRFLTEQKKVDDFLSLYFFYNKTDFKNLNDFYNQITNDFKYYNN